MSHEGPEPSDWAGLAEIYTMHSFAPFSNLNFFVKNRQNVFAIQVGGRHLPSVSYGQSYQQTYFDIGFSVSSVFAFLDRRVSLHILAGRLSSNSSSAALIFVFCATRRIRFFVSDLFQKRPSWRGKKKNPSEKAEIARLISIRRNLQLQKGMDLTHHERLCYARALASVHVSGMGCHKDQLAGREARRIGNEKKH